MRLALISSHTHKQARPSPSPTSDRCWKEHRRLRARARTTPGLPRQMEFIELPAAYRAVQPEYRAAQTTLNGTRKAHGPSVSRHFEEKHYANSWNLDMNLEESLGLVPKAWSTSNAMNDHRPNGHAMFDARHIHSPVPRVKAHGGHDSPWDPRGVVCGGDAIFAASEMADETLAGAASAEANKIENNQGARVGRPAWS